MKMFGQDVTHFIYEEMHMGVGEGQVNDKEYHSTEMPPRARF